MRAITFSGYTWDVRESKSPSMPGPNTYSADSVLASDTHLTLSIKHTESRWDCSEVALQKPLGYGIYTYDIGPLHDIDSSVVCGAFLYEHDTQEIDIEVSPTMVGLGKVQFAIQPTWKFWNVRKKPIDLSVPATHRIVWTPTSLIFSITDTQTQKELAFWKWRGVAISSPERALFVFNVWLFNDVPVTKNQQVTLSAFSFTPLKE